MKAYRMTTETIGRAWSKVDVPVMEEDPAGEWYARADVDPQLEGRALLADLARALDGIQLLERVASVAVFNGVATIQGANLARLLQLDGVDLFVRTAKVTPAMHALATLRQLHRLVSAADQEFGPSKAESIAAMRAVFDAEVLALLEVQS